MARETIMLTPEQVENVERVLAGPARVPDEAAQDSVARFLFKLFYPTLGEWVPGGGKWVAEQAHCNRAARDLVKAVPSLAASRVPSAPGELREKAIRAVRDKLRGAQPPESKRYQAAMLVDAVLGVLPSPFSAPEQVERGHALDRISYLAGYIAACGQRKSGITPDNDSAVMLFAERSWKATGAARAVLDAVSGPPDDSAIRGALEKLTEAVSVVGSYQGMVESNGKARAWLDLHRALQGGLAALGPVSGPPESDERDPRDMTITWDNATGIYRWEGKPVVVVDKERFEQMAAGPPKEER